MSLLLLRNTTVELRFLIRQLADHRDPCLDVANSALPMNLRRTRHEA